MPHFRPQSCRHKKSGSSGISVLFDKRVDMGAPIDDQPKSIKRRAEHARAAGDQHPGAFERR